MKKELKIIALSALMVLSAASLASCGNSKTIPDFTMPEGGFNFEEEVEITFYHTMGKALSDVLDIFLEPGSSFSTKYPNIIVNHQQIGSYDDVRDQITTALGAGAAGSECDVAYCYPDHLAMYNKNKAIVTLDTLIDDTIVDENGELVYGMSQATKDDYVDAYWDEGMAFGDGKMYMLPWAKSSEVLYYNKTFFDEHSLSVPDHWFSTGEDDTTSVEYVCAKIQDIDPDSIPLGYDSDSNWFITMCEHLESGYTSYDEDNHYIFDNETNRNFVSTFAEWYKKGYVTTKSLNGAYTSSLFTNVPTKENPVRSYMSIGSTAGAGNQVPESINGKQYFEVGVAAIPQANSAKPKVISQGPSVCLFRNEDPQKVLASWLFIKHFTTDVYFQSQFSMTSGYTPVIKSVNDNQTYANFLNSNSVVAMSTKQCVDQADAYFVSPAFAGSADARNEVGYLLQAAMSKAKSIDKAFADALSSLDYKG